MDKNHTYYEYRKSILRGGPNLLNPAVAWVVAGIPRRVLEIVAQRLGASDPYADRIFVLALRGPPQGYSHDVFGMPANAFPGYAPWVPTPRPPRHPDVESNEGVCFWVERLAF
ncbi:MAG: hypothetical protein JO069_17175 [Verrucomicrobia bacterium]|nr:hypothetical protein [Verrucomicrobiota bacterium]